VKYIGSHIDIRGGLENPPYSSIYVVWCGNEKKI